MKIESHPLKPFLPFQSKVLFLGSFPPPKNRWSMEFFYPNWINDFWRIMGILYFGDKTYFEIPTEKRFDKDRIVSFCNEKGFAFFDSATRICRLRDSASDNYLQIVESTDISALLTHLPDCKAIVTTGGKSSEEVASILGVQAVPEIGGCIEVAVGDVKVSWYRVPSSSRAYPMKLERKAEIYGAVLFSIL